MKHPDIDEGAGKEQTIMYLLSLAGENHVPFT